MSVLNKSLFFLKITKLNSYDAHIAWVCLYLKKIVNCICMQ